MCIRDRYCPDRLKSGYKYIVTGQKETRTSVLETANRIGVHMTIQYPDYNNCLVNLACSILKHFGAHPQHATLPVLDSLLKKQYTNVVVMLFDGMGSEALEFHLPEDSFLRRHCTADISSVFPPTTTAAITS